MPAHDLSASNRVGVAVYRRNLSLVTRAWGSDPKFNLAVTIQGPSRRLCRLLASTLQGRSESGIVHSPDELIDTHPRGIEYHPRLFVAEVHLRSLHAREPLQGSLDRDRSSASGHPLNRKHDRRRLRR